MKCAKSTQDCDWCDKSYDCQIYQSWKKGQVALSQVQESIEESGNNE